VEEVNRTILKDVHLSCDPESSDRCRFLFFEISRIHAQNYRERYSFIMLSSITWWISLGFFRNERKTWTQICWEMFIYHAIFDHSMNLAFYSSKWVEEMNTTMLRHVHLSCDLWSSDQYRLVFFQISRTGEHNYTEKCSFIMWSSIIRWISLSFLRNERNRWTQLCWDMFICQVIFNHLIDIACFFRNKQNGGTELYWEMFIYPVIFNHSMNLAFFSSKWAEQVNISILRNVHLSCNLKLSHESRFLFFEMSRTSEQNYAEKYSFIMLSSIIWLISLYFLRNEQKTWKELCWKIFICHVI
jgi:hypothetical protein